MGVVCVALLLLGLLGHATWAVNEAEEPFCDYLNRSQPIPIEDLVPTVTERDLDKQHRLPNHIDISKAKRFVSKASL